MYAVSARLSQVANFSTKRLSFPEGIFPICSMFVPGNVEKMLAKAATVPGVDICVPDLEDSVPFDQKVNARDQVKASFESLSAGKYLIMPRVNDVRSPWFKEDVLAMTNPLAFGLNIGKINDENDIAIVDGALADAERSNGLVVGSMRLIPTIESPAAIVNLKSIAAASSRIVALAFGADDYRAALGINRESSAAALHFARCSIAVVASAAGISAFDSPPLQWKDPDALERESGAVAALGFTGQYVIHPLQIQPVLQAFKPSAKDIQWAMSVTEAWEKSILENRGSLTHNGLMVDAPVIRTAVRILLRGGLEVSDAARAL